MRKIEKEFVASAKPLKSKVFNELWIINSGRAYNGFFGKNGFNNIIVIGRYLGKGHSLDKELITNHSDSVDFTFPQVSFHTDIDNATGIVHLWTDGKWRLREPVMSSCIFEVES